MNDNTPDTSEAKASRTRRKRLEAGILAAVCALVIGVYAYSAHSSFLFMTSLRPDGERYNLMVQGFQAGQLSLKKGVPAELKGLANPYDPAAASHSSALDMSYYKGKLYLYYGVTPVFVLFWPFVTITRHYLSQKIAALILCAAGFLASVGWLCSMWKRYFPQIGVGTVAAITVALGLAAGAPSLLARCDVYEVSICSGYAFTMLALASTWMALHDPNRRVWWLGMGSFAYGLAVAARPSLMFGAVILMAPVIHARRNRQRAWALLMAAIIPIALIGSGLMIYNALRFDDPFEFGLRYALSGDRPSTAPPFNPRYLWYHFRVYFLEPARWTARLPFVRDITGPPPPAGHGRVEHPFGILTNIPVVWLALAVSLAWRGRSREERSVLRGFLAAVVFLFGANALTLSLFFSASIRYEGEFLPALTLLSVIGILSIERALSDRPLWRRAACWGWSLLLGFSVAFNLFASPIRCAEAHCNLGALLEHLDRMPEAAAQYQRAVRLDPDSAEAHRLLGNRLFEEGRMSEAISHYEQTVRLDPDSIEAYNNLGVALSRLGRLPEAAKQFRHALRISAESAEAHANLAIVLSRLGDTSEAMEHFERSLQISPDDAETHYDFAVALEKAGQVQEAIQHYQEALRIKPDFVEARNALARARAAQ